MYHNNDAGIYSITDRPTRSEYSQMASRGGIAADQPLKKRLRTDDRDDVGLESMLDSAGSGNNGGSI